MDPQNDRSPSEQAPPDQPPPAPKKRFRIEKLEERIAPKKGGNGTNKHCGSATASLATADSCASTPY